MTDKLVDLIGIGNLLESLVTEDVITCEERDQIMAKIAKENGIAEHEYKSPHIASYGMSKREVLERMGRRKPSMPQDKIQDESYISLTEIARAHSEDAPGYVIQRCFAYWAASLMLLLRCSSCAQKLSGKETGDDFTADRQGKSR